MKTTRAVLPYQNRPGRRSSRRKLSLSWAWQWIRPREGGSVAHTSPWSLACRSWSWGPGRPCPHTTSLIRRRCWINTFTKDSPKGPFRFSGKILMQLYPSRKHSQCLHAAECRSFGLVSKTTFLPSSSRMARKSCMRLSGVQVGSGMSAIKSPNSSPYVSYNE